MDLDKIQDIGKIMIQYYNQVELNPTQRDFELWIESLKEPMKSSFSKQGLNKCKGVLNFKRFLLEMNDFGLEEYMKKNLSAEDYKMYKSKNE